MTKVYGLVFICFGWTFADAQGLNVFHIEPLKSGTIQCSPDPLEVCELSAIQSINNQNGVLELYAANDKQPRNPKTSSLMKLRLDENLSVYVERFIDIPRTANAEKFEAMTALPDGTIIASTAFNFSDRTTNNKVLAINSRRNYEIYEVNTTANASKDSAASNLNFYDYSMPNIGSHCMNEVTHLAIDVNSLHKSEFPKRIKSIQDAIRCLNLQKTELQKILSSDSDTKLVGYGSRKFEPLADQGPPASLRSLIGDTLDRHTRQKNDYFKVEGIAIYGENKIVFAVREYGLKFETKVYSSIFIEGVLSVTPALVSINHLQPFKIAADFSSELKNATGRDVGVSSLEYNKSDGKLYFLTSFEPNDDIANRRFSSYLWSVDLNSDNSINKKTLAMAKLIDNSSVNFQHKAEGLTFLSENTAIVVHDDDRELTGVNGWDDPIRRNINEAAYTIFKIVSYPRRKLLIQ